MASNESVKDQDQINGIEKANEPEQHTSSSEESEEDVEPLGEDHSMAQFCQSIAGTEELCTLLYANLNMALDYSGKKFVAEETGQEFEETLDPCSLCLFCKEGQPCCRFLLLEHCGEYLKKVKNLVENENNLPTN